MAYVTAKAGGRFEIRESRRTPEGPRAVTLATFRVLDEEVLAQAAARAASTFDTRSIRAGARKLGAPIQPSRADHLARALLAEITGGADPSPGLRQLLERALAQSGVRDSEAGDGADVGDLGDLAQWIDAPEGARARALEDLLGLADAIPSRRRPDQLRFPRLVSTSVD